MDERRNKTLTGVMLGQAMLEALRKLNPAVMVKNPVMFLVEAGTVIALLLAIDPSLFGTGDGGRGYNLAVF